MSECLGKGLGAKKSKQCLRSTQPVSSHSASQLPRGKDGPPLSVMGGGVGSEVSSKMKTTSLHSLDWLEIYVSYGIVLITTSRCFPYDITR